MAEPKQTHPTSQRARKDIPTWANCALAQSRQPYLFSKRGAVLSSAPIFGKISHAIA
jgi:hypothetical protein